MNNTKPLQYFVKISLILFVLFSIVLMNGSNEIFVWDLLTKNDALLVKISTISGYLAFIGAIIIDQFSRNKYLNIIRCAFCLISIVLFCFLKTIYKDNVLEEGVELTVGPSIVLGVLYMVNIFFKGLRQADYQLNMNIRDMVEIGMFSAMAIILDLTFFKIKIWQNGGSISLVMLPLAIMSYRKGLVKGFIGCGLVFGFLSCLIDGYGFVTYPLDYLGAFGSIAFVGLFKTFKLGERKNVIQFICLGALFVIAVAFRTLFATLSGVVLWGSGFIASLSYNATYILPSAAIVLILLLVTYKPLNKIFRRKTN